MTLPAHPVDCGGVGALDVELSLAVVGKAADVWAEAVLDTWISDEDTGVSAVRMLLRGVAEGVTAAV